MLTDTFDPVDDPGRDGRDLLVQVLCYGLCALVVASLFTSAISPAVLVVITLVPWALLMLVLFGHGRYLLYGPDGHSVIIGALVLPVALGVTAIVRIHIIDWRAPLGTAIGLWVGYGLLAWLADASVRSERPEVMVGSKRGGWPAMVIAGAMLAWATLVDANAITTSAPAQDHLVHVARKWASHGRSRTNYLVFSDAPDLGVTDFDTPARLWFDIAPGDRACLVINTGLLGWRWYTVAAAAQCGDAVWGKS